MFSKQSPLAFVVFQHNDFYHHFVIEIANHKIQQMLKHDKPVRATLFAINISQFFFITEYLSNAFISALINSMVCLHRGTSIVFHYRYNCRRALRKCLLTLPTSCYSQSIIFTPLNLTCGQSGIDQKVSYCETLLIYRTYLNVSQNNAYKLI